MTDIQFDTIVSLISACSHALRVLVVASFFIAGHLGYLIYIKGSEK